LLQPVTSRRLLEELRYLDFRPQVTMTYSISEIYIRLKIQVDELHATQTGSSGYCLILSHLQHHDTTQLPLDTLLTALTPIVWNTHRCTNDCNKYSYSCTLARSPTYLHQTTHNVRPRQYQHRSSTLLLRQRRRFLRRVKMAKAAPQDRRRALDPSRLRPHLLGPL
jgi:hypothetical protein